jgi:hypothetical protein
MALKATVLASKKPRNVGRIFTVGLPRFVSNKANPRCAISLNRSPFLAGPAFKARMKRQSKVCAPIRSLVSAQLPDRKQSRQSRADGLRSVLTMIDHEGQSSLESIMNWMPRSLDSDCCFIADAPGRINDVPRLGLR